MERPELSFDDYNGFPVRFPHWKWEAYVEDAEHGCIHEMVINTVPEITICCDLSKHLQAKGRTIRPIQPKRKLSVEILDIKEVIYD